MEDDGVDIEINNSSTKTTVAKYAATFVAGVVVGWYAHTHFYQVDEKAIFEAQLILKEEQARNEALALENEELLGDYRDSMASASSLIDRLKRIESDPNCSDARFGTDRAKEFKAILKKQEALRQQ